MNFAKFLKCMLLISSFWNIGVNGLHCNSCNSIEDKNCASDPVNGNKIKCQNETDSCVSVIIDGKVFRGCESNAEFSKNSDIYEKCRTTGCNTDSYSPNGITCIKCSGSDCKNRDMVAIECPNTNECYTCDDKDGRIERGCGNNEGSTMRCRTCQNINECNNEQPLFCYNCHSANNPTCVQRKDSLEEEVKQCERVNDECITAIEDGDTVRGCESEAVNTCNDPELCVRCREDKCNSGIVPEDRIICHQCKNTKECSGEQNKDMALPCSTYEKYDSCYYYLHEESGIQYTVRGCFSDESYGECINNRTCYNCYEPGCNYEDASQFTEACIKCESQSYTCPWSQIPDNAVKCGPNYPPGCFIKTHDNGTVSRGCRNQIDACLADDDSCTVCNGPRCNIESLVSQVCIQCNSSMRGQQTCAETAESINPLHCKSSNQLFETHGCYIKRIGDTVLRGCLSDLPTDEFNNCLNESYKSCIFCSRQICNIGNAPDTAANINIISHLFILLIAFSAANILKY